MANDNYSAAVPATDIRRTDEEEPPSLILQNGYKALNGYEGSKTTLANKRGGTKISRYSNRTKSLTAEIKMQLSVYWKEGQLTYAQIVERINEEFQLEGTDRIKVGTIEYYIKTLLEAARKQSLLHINERQALVLARYDQIEMLLTEAYFKSFKSETVHYERMVKQAQSKERQIQLAADMKRERAKIDRRNIKRRLRGQPLLKYPEIDPLGDLPELLMETTENIKEYKQNISKPSGDPKWVKMMIEVNDKRAGLWGLKNRTDTLNADAEMAKLSDEDRESRMAAVLHRAITRRSKDTGTLAQAGPLGGFAEGDEPVHADDKLKDVPEDTWEWD